MIKDNVHWIVDIHTYMTDNNKNIDTEYVLFLKLC